MATKRRKSRPTQISRIIDRGALSVGARTKQTKNYIYLLFHWKKIVGERNLRIMAPLAIKKSTLVVAVPNSMVKHNVFPTLPLLLSKIHAQGEEFSSISFIRLQVQAAVFPKKRKKRVEEDKTLSEPSEEELGFRTTELIKEGISEELAPHLARLFYFAEIRKTQ
ncbi:DUF721 domain-containing protein [bacterium]|nr:DUF721 domain-containing protein [bacterium]